MQSGVDVAVTLGWSDDTVPLHTHACFYYADEATLLSTLAFLRVGLDAPGEVGVIFADASRHESLLGALQEGYPDRLAGLLESGKLVLIGGAPTREELLANIGTALDRAVASGCDLIRFLGFIAWGKDGWPDESSLLQFESEVNTAVRAYPAVIICTYGVPNLSGTQLVDGGIVTHPVLFLNGRVLPANPLHLDPAVDQPA